MKQNLSFFIIFCNIILLSCNSTQNDAAKQAEQIQKTVKANTPGTVPTSESGYYMKAKINGKDWVAKDMLPNNNEDTRPIFGEADGQKISFTIWMQHPKEGRKETFKEGNVAELMGFEDVATCDAKKGEAIVTKIDDHAIEGTFFMTGTSNQSAKTIEVTDGFFRILKDK
ncbi:MAG: DUF6252 family protein [Bacteroidota bacterium]|nr:DUF6252 family protein [Bacteroidota bacterium]